MNKTVVVRIAVVVNEFGHWSASGFYNFTNKEAIKLAQEGLDELGQERVFFVEAELTIPEAETVQGVVKDDSPVNG